VRQNGAISFKLSDYSTKVREDRVLRYVGCIDEFEVQKSLGTGKGFTKAAKYKNTPTGQ